MTTITSVKTLHKDYIKSWCVFAKDQSDHRYYKSIPELLIEYDNTETVVNRIKLLVGRLQFVYDNAPSQRIYYYLDRCRWLLYFAMTAANRAYKGYNPQAGIGKPFSDVLPYTKKKMKQSPLAIMGCKG